MIIYITICITLLTIIAGMHLILKSKNEGTSAIFKWISYLIVLAGLLILLCQVVRGVMMMRHHGDMECKEECHPWMRCNNGMNTMNGCSMMGNHSGMRKCCDMDKEQECCDMKMKGDSAHSMMDCKGMMKNEEGMKEEQEEKQEKK